MILLNINIILRYIQYIKKSRVVIRSTCTCQRDHDDHVLGAAVGQRPLQILEEQAVPLHPPLAHHLADPHVLEEDRLAPPLPVHRVHVKRVIEARIEAPYLETRAWIPLLVYGRRLAPHRPLVALRRVERRRISGGLDGILPRRPPDLEQKVLRRATVRAWDAIHLEEGGGLVVERAVGWRLRWLCEFTTRVCCKARRERKLRIIISGNAFFSWKFLLLNFPLFFFPFCIIISRRGSDLNNRFVSKRRRKIEGKLYF